MKKVLIIKKFLFIVFLCLNPSIHGQNTYIGMISQTVDPGMTVPEPYPDVVYCFMTVSGTYILTVNSLPVEEELVVNDTKYSVGDIVAITGKTSVRQSSFLEGYYELEIETIERSSLHQDYQRFAGTYLIEGTCSRNNSFYPIQDTIIISEWGGISLPEDWRPNHWEWTSLDKFYLTLFVSEDSLFVSPQWLYLFRNNNSISITGKGKVENDSIFFDFVRGLYPDDFSRVVFTTCTCKGKKSTSSGLVSPPEYVQNNAYYDAVKQAIVFNTTLQNQSFTFELMDIQGKVMLKKTGTDNYSPVNVSHLSSGVYVYRLIKDGLVIGRGKIVKIN
jgi:hypothetical protein